MKDRTLLILPLLMSALALALAARTHFRAEQLAAEAFKKREQEIASHFAPRFKSLCEGLTHRTNIYSSDPTTFEELLEPIVISMEQLGSDPAAEEPEK
jgi:hypothetical protein